ncbi:intradiol ring-cleavage dioxygenase [Aquincola sp. S2]|uniref:Intradiol ring-cleavage dioxygenase n=1 Tax=Pseudaquabacterium terrae TaxID=2732868 RepID=A0ABX2ECH8_9BURK|nr:intradiol ring-cleavage dioxygenase [Aquabacterium terrae]NRF66303.1 intradiol ring-cleavage dioxygenase [Aquabacterium terrae]
MRLHDDHHAHDGGLATDLPLLIRQAADRRRALRWLAGGGAAAGLLLAGCGGGGDDSTATTTTGTGTGTGTSIGTGTSTGTGTTSCSVIPEETAGPYPGDGSNSSNGGVANALMLSGIVRSDIRSSIAGATGTAAGIPLTMRIQVVNTGASCASLAGHAIYLWHCDRDGNYSMYSASVANQNYLRGVQATGSDGVAVFQTIFPGCYDGRMPHMHFEIYRSTNTATSFSNKLKTSQIAFPTDVCTTVYNTSAYATSLRNLGRISFTSDNVFSDGYSTQLATLTGNTSDGYVGTLQVGISA